ncbi:MAG: hypothetical protein OXC53_09065, partial [Rhodobacteraceae bacterium]|nr:hypothetical protein [Paracoccaceae bacterium]
SQAELLNLYWKHRVESHGAAAQACLLRIVKSMVENRVLRAPFEIAAKSDAAVLDALEGEGVLVSIDNRRGVQFRHHLLFDFAAARTLLDPQEIIDGRQRFGKPEAPGLMLAQALRFVLQEIWIRAPNRADFWTAVAHILAEKYGDPVIRSAGSRTCAEFPRQHEDTVILAQRIVSGDQKAAQAFTQICGAFGIRLEDEPHVELGPWVGLARGLAANVAPVCGSLRFLLFHLVGRVGDPKARCDLGIAARSLLDHAFSLESPGNLVAAAIDLVGETYASDMQQSRELLLRVFTPNRLDVHAAREVPGICQKIDKISRADPEFAVRIYRETFDFEVTDVQESYIGNSQILGLRSNTRQDYGMARHLLKKHFRTFLDLDPDHAIQAVVHAVEVYVDRKHPGNTNLLDVELSIGSCSVRLREDLSHIWAHDPESDYGDDAEALIKELLAHLRSADEAVVTRIAKRLVETASLAIFWSRLFLAASERKDKLLDFCLPIAMQQEFLTLRDTVKDAVDVVAGGYNRMSRPEREGFEVAVTGSDFSKLSSPDHARASMERRLFSKIGEANLITDRARAIAKEHGPVEGNENDRPFSVTLTTISPEPYHWIEDLDRAAPANQKLMKAIDRIKATFGIESDACHASDLTLEDSLREIEIFISEIDPQTQNPRLVIYAEGQISKCICHLVDRKQVPAVSESPENAERFCDLLLATVNSADPILDEDTEAKFENSASWGSPAPRVDAARAVLELTRQRPDLYPRFESVIDNLLQDLHPAVRLEAALYLVSIWDIDQAGFWRRLAERLAIEPNIGVLDHICSEVLGRVVHTDAERTEHLALDLLGRFECETDRCSRMRQCLSSLIAILSVMHQRQNSQKILESWIVDAAAYSAELSTVIHTLGEVFDAGLTGTSRPETAGFRLRSQEIVHDVVSAANAGLALHFQIDSPSVEQEDIGRKYALLLDLVCSQIFVAAKSIRAGSSREGSFDDHALAMFLDEVYDILEIIGKCAAPHTVHCLLQLTELLVPVNPARAFDLTMNAMLSGGRQTGYQFEAMGSDLLVKLMGQFLADHRELFEGEDRRTALIDSLELFMDAGWPSAQRLLYRLPELIQ